MPFSESDKYVDSSRMVVMQALDSGMKLFHARSSTQADDSSPWPASGRPGDNAVNARKSSAVGSCEDDEEGHLVYHAGLVMKERCR